MSLGELANSGLKEFLPEFIGILFLILSIAVIHVIKKIKK